jgi:primosomal protein N' (replication factor Y)
MLYWHKDSFTHKSLSFAWCDFSGKTEIYIKLIEEYLITGKQVLYLLPEITYYSTGWEAKSLFGNRVAVFHSKYSSNERVEVWKQVLRNSEKHR